MSARVVSLAFFLAGPHISTANVTDQFMRSVCGSSEDNRE
jgi:hypothetical protein